MNARRALVATLAFGLAFAGSLAPSRAAASAAPWVALSDIHLGYEPPGGPTPPGDDTNSALFESLLRELQRRDPRPPVVIIAGDFLAHTIDHRRSIETVDHIAKRFDAVYPHAQFVITLGNNDSACGDYSAPVDGPFLAAMARAWEPLVNRNGAAPGFRRSFAHDGSYVARLPVPGLRAVVIDDVPFTLRYNAACAGGVNAGGESLADLTTELRSGPPNERSWLIMHVPPGVDAYSTSYLAHKLAVIPFMRPRAGDALLDVIEDPHERIALVVAGHTHKFSYRIAAGPPPVPMLLLPSISPIFWNRPSFLELPVDRVGNVGNVREISYGYPQWRETGDLASLGARTFSAGPLLELQRRLEREPALRDRFATLYTGAGSPEIKGNWRVYWCAATALRGSAFEACEDPYGLGILRPRALKLGALALAALAGVGVLIAMALRARGRKRPRRA